MIYILCKYFYFRVSRHKEVWSSRQQEIEQHKTQKLKFQQINDELRLKRLTDDINKCLKIKEVLLPAELPEEEPSLPELTDEQISLVKKALDKSRNANEVMAKKFNLNITRRDLMTLDGLNWLNDEVINFYMNLIIQRGDGVKWPKSYAMNTFFYPKLLKDGHDSIRR